MRLVLRIIAFIAICWTASISAEVRIVITDGVNAARPIAVLPFKWTGIDAMPQDISSIIAADLRNSGKFSPVDAGSMPQNPQSIAEINPKLWADMGIDAVVMGTVRPGADGKYLIDYQLIDTVDVPGDVIAQNHFSVSGRWLRYAAHTASDEIFLKLTGIKGVFRTRIAYVLRKRSSGDYSYELNVADYDGYDQVTVHRSSEPIMSPAWSADGERIAFVSFENRRSVLMSKTLSTGALDQLASFPGHNGSPAFSPDGSKIAMALSRDGNLNIYVMDLATRALRQVTTGRSNNTEPSWYPDGRTLAYTSDQSGRPQIYTININSDTPRRLTWEGRQNQNVSVSPEGSFMVMVSINDERKQSIVKLNAESGAQQALTTTFLDETPSIAPNGTMIIYSSTQGLGNVLNIVSSDGRFKARLPVSAGDAKFPAWSPYL